MPAAPISRASAIRRPGILLPLALVLAPALVVYAVLFHDAVSIPLLDDYNAVLNFLQQQRALPTAGARLVAVVQFQHAEYKLIFEHLFFCAWFALTGHISFPLFLTLGNLLLLPAAWALWKSSFRDEPALARRLWLFAPVSLLLFELTYAELLDWVMASLSALAVVAFALCSLHLLARRSRVAGAAACLIAALACASSSSGFLLAPAGLIVLWPTRSLRRTLAWCAPFALLLPAYLFRYTLIPHAATSLATKALFFLSFLGGAIENIHGFPIRHAGFALGTLLLILVAHSVRTRFWQREPTLFAMLAWVLLTAAVAAAVRSEAGVQQSLASRYKIYSVLLLIYAYLYVADRLRHRGAQRHSRLLYSCTLAAALVFSASADIVGSRFLARRHDRLVEGLARYQADPAHTSPLYAPDDPEDFSQIERTFERDTLTQAIRTGIYRPPTHRTLTREQTTD